MASVQSAVRVEFAEPAVVRGLPELRLSESGHVNQFNRLNVRSFVEVGAAKHISVSGLALRPTFPIRAVVTSLSVVLPSVAHSAGNAERLLVTFMADDTATVTGPPRRVDVALRVVDA